MKRIYIAGPVTGHADNNRDAFRKAAEELADRGFATCNPVATIERLESEPNHREAMRLCIGWMVDCDGIALLPGWQDSAGALLEHTVAYECGMEIRPLAGWLR